MNFASAPLRFVVGVLGLWVSARAVMTLDFDDHAVASPSPPAHAPSATARPMRMPSPEAVAPAMARASAFVPPAHATGVTHARQALPRATRVEASPALAREGARLQLAAISGGAVGASISAVDAPHRPGPAPLPGPVSTKPPSRWSGTAYIFLRQDDSQASLASGGQLGGSQMFVRGAYAVSRRAAIAARMYSPVETLEGAEAAVGADLHLARGATPVRLSVERRIALGNQARNAWAAYAAGGFYTAAPLGMEADGYGQAGVVGARSRDLFADGALRLTRPVPLPGRARGGVGVGMWGAAQPGVERLDIGPRASLSHPVADRSITMNIDLRLRVAGNARPGTGVAITIGSDF